MRAFPALVLAAWLCAGAPAAAAQCTGDACEPPGDWRAEAATLAVNALLGGVAGGTVRALRGGSFAEGFAGGAAGGALVYAGKRVAVERWTGAGLAGREVAAVGTSIIRNSAEGRGPLQRLVLPLWIARVYVVTGPRVSVQPRLDLAGALAVAYQASRSNSEFDLERSLSSGAPVFRVYDPLVKWDGYQLAGMVLLSYSPSYRGLEDRLPTDMRLELEGAAAHERVHVLQDDEAFLLLAAPLEDVVLNATPLTARVHRWVDPGVLTAVLYLPGALIPYTRRPWEREAEFLSNQPR
jgi:hypothetical protein